MHSGEIIHKEIASNFVHKFIKMHGFYMHVLEGHRLENVFFLCLMYSGEIIVFCLKTHTYNIRETFDFLKITCGAGPYGMLLNLSNA